MQRWDKRVQEQAGDAGAGDSEAAGDGDGDDSPPMAAVTCCGVRVAHPRGWQVRLEAVTPAEAAAATAAAVAAEAAERGDADGDSQRAHAAADAGMLLHGLRAGDALALRLRRDGDRFAPHWRRGGRSVRLAEFLREAGVPLHARDRMPLLTWQSDGRRDGATIAAVFPIAAAAPLHAPDNGEGGVSVRLFVRVL
jgi:tRNA(Ile)-lysidine synthetase-like protein